MNPQAEIRSVTGVPAPATDGPTTTIDKIVARNGNAVEIPLLEGSTADITTINSTDVNADNIIANNIVNTSGATASGSRRQTVLSGRKASVHADFIERSTGLSVVAKASPSEPIVTTIASGWDTYGKPVNFNNAITSDITFSGLTPNATNFIGLKKNGNILDQVVTLLPPVYGSVFSSDRENKINASFNGNNNDTEFVDEYGNHFRAYGAGWQISNVNQYSGMNTARCNSIAAGNRWECTPANLDNRSLDQWTIEGFYRLDSFATEQAVLNANSGENTSTGLMFLIGTSGQPLLYLSSDEGSYNLMNAANTVNMNAIAYRSGFGNIAISAGMHTANEWYHMAWVFDGLAHRIYINGYLVMTFSVINVNEVFVSGKPAKFNKIILGARYAGSSAQNQLIGNISNFAFHPYAKYQTKKYVVNGDTPADRDIFTPPSVPLSLTTQSDRYYQESEAIYLDFESANATAGNNNTVPEATYRGDILAKDYYGRTLVCCGNATTSNLYGGYVDNNPLNAKFGNNYLRFNGDADIRNCAYIKAPVWADKWTVEFWGMRNDALNTINETLVSLVVPGVFAGYAFQVVTIGNGSAFATVIDLSSNDSASDIGNTISAYSYAPSVYHHFAVSYDGVTYRVFVNGVNIFSFSSQLKVANGSHFIFGRHPNNQYHLNGRIDDFAYVPYCKYTAGFTPPATALLASMPEQYVFDTKKMQMYKGYPTSFVADNSLFLGEALTSATNVEQIITYALNGEYRERFSGDLITQFNSLITRKHNVGSDKIIGKLYAKNLQSASIKGELMEIMTYDTAPYLLPPLGIVDRKLYAIHSGSSGFVLINTSGSTQVINASNSHYIDFDVTVQRTF